MGKTPPHISLYHKLVEVQNLCNQMETNPLQEEKFTRHQMSQIHASTENHYDPGLYEIRLKGHLDDRWAAWFEDLTLTREDNDNTLLTGLVVDQAALHGLLRKVRDLGMPLISVIRIEPDPDQSAGLAVKP